MPSLTITTRLTKSGPSYAVRYRLGGRDWPVKHGGSFKRKKDAETRKRLIGGEIAAGRNPRDLLQALKDQPTHPQETLREVARRYALSRVDLASTSADKLLGHCKPLLALLGDRDPQTIGWSDIQDVVSSMSARERPAAPGTIRVYRVTWRQLFDFAECEPNPARDRRLKLPRMISEEPNLPTAKQFIALADKLPGRYLLPTLVMEQTAMAVSETVSLPWGDVDVAECDFRLRYANVKGAIRSRARFVQVPRWLMDAIEQTCPREDRTAERPVFTGVTASTVRRAMSRACTAAGIPNFTPHELRHRRATIWHHGGVVARVLAERLGHCPLLDQPRRVQPHARPRRGSNRAVFGPYRPLSAVAVWSRCGLSRTATSVFPANRTLYAL